jgi:hypothetical protein
MKVLALLAELVKTMVVNVNIQNLFKIEVIEEMRMVLLQLPMPQGRLDPRLEGLRYINPICKVRAPWLMH